jgi:hypothetical protein
MGFAKGSTVLRRQPHLAGFDFRNSLIRAGSVKQPSAHRREAQTL